MTRLTLLPYYCVIAVLALAFDTTRAITELAEGRRRLRASRPARRIARAAA